MEKIIFEDLPSTKTPLNAENLNKMQDNFEQEVLDTGWIDAELKPEFQLYNDKAWCQYRKIGKIVQIRGNVKPTQKITGSSTMTPIFSLPSGFIPSKNQYEVCQGSGTNKWLLTVSDNSNVGISRYSNNETSNEVGTNAWLVFNITYFVD